jgi:hypothetical protein
VHFHFATVDGELWVNAQTPPLLPYLQEPSSICQNPGLFTGCARWHLSKATSAPSQASESSEVGPAFFILNMASYCSLWSITSAISFVKKRNVITFSQENKSSHLFWLPHINSRTSLPFFKLFLQLAEFLYLTICPGQNPLDPTPLHHVCQSRKYSSKIPSSELVKDFF